MLRGFCALCALALVVPLCSTQVRGESLSLKEAVRLALVRAPEIAVESGALEEAEGARAQAGALPNPTADYSWERLRRNGAPGGEWSMAVSAPLEALWIRGPSVRSADAGIDAASLRLAHVRALVSREVQAAYVRSHFNRRKRVVLEQVSDLFRETARKGTTRELEGDISAYERQRIDLEAARYERRLSEAILQEAASRRSLIYYLGGADREIETTLSGPLVVFDGEAGNAVTASMERRADLLSARAASRAAEASVISEGRRGLPTLSLSAGYKSQDAGFEGTQIAVSLGLPLFDRNQGGKRGAAATMYRARAAAEGIERRVEVEVLDAIDRYRSTKTQLARLQSVAPPDAILETVRTTYGEGALSLVEMLDGLRAYADAASDVMDLEASHYISQIDLALAMGLPADATQP